MKFIASRVEELRPIAREFLKIASKHQLFAFNGEMGVGKTTFISYIVEEMGGGTEVASPTYGYVNEYESEKFGTIYHFDLYRIHSEEEAYDIGIEEYIYEEKFVFIEWPERIANLLPENCVWVNISRNSDNACVIEIDL